MTTTQFPPPVVAPIAPTLDQLIAQFRRQPNPLSAPKMKPSGVEILPPQHVLNGSILTCAHCQATDGLMAHFSTLRVHKDSRNKRYAKTAGFVASALVLGFGARKNLYSDIEVMQIECMRCGAICVVGLEGEEFDGWGRYGDEFRAEFRKVFA